MMQEYDNEAEQAICDVLIHYTDTPLDIGMSSRWKLALLIMNVLICSVTLICN